MQLRAIHFLPPLAILPILFLTSSPNVFLAILFFLALIGILLLSAKVIERTDSVMKGTLTFVFGLGILLLALPKAQTIQALKSNVRGYPTHRLTFRFKPDNHLTGPERIEAITPFLTHLNASVTESYGKYLAPRNLGYRRDYVRVTMPTYYRATESSLEVELGGTVNPELLALLRAGFDALPRFGSLNAIPEALPVVIEGRGSMTLLPRTAQLDTRASLYCGTITMQVVLAGDSIASLGDEFAHATAPPLREASYIVRGFHATNEQRQNLDYFLHLQPSDMPRRVALCADDLVSHTDPALAMANLFNTLDFPGSVDQVIVEDSNFSYWQRHGWTKWPSTSKTPRGLAMIGGGD